jgi:hypothetical protein
MHFKRNLNGILKYELDHNGDPILSKNRNVPPLGDNKVDEVPILGLPLITYAAETGITGKENSDLLWQVFSSMIINEASTNKDGSKGPMPMEKMIDMRELTIDIEDMIAKARTYGINITKHGFSEEFRK